ncbi:MAG TPA: putative toxin-antitoxin system toxin component, PIN family [Phycisphaerae bacterium]|nr:putative toxin-antitoxin system toxin component, PIN family [Phycisphaerae bacterium]
MISSLIKGWWRQIADAVEVGRLTLITSPAAIDEFVDVSRRPHIAKLIDPEDAEEVANLLRRAELFRPAQIPTICRDPNDDYLLALAATATADRLVSRDEDLLVLRQHGNTKIVPIAEFLQEL